MQPERNSLKLVKALALSIAWALYSHVTRLIVVATGPQDNVMHGVQIQPGALVRFPKFEIALAPPAQDCLQRGLELQELLLAGEQIALDQRLQLRVQLVVVQHPRRAARHERVRERIPTGAATCAGAAEAPVGHLHEVVAVAVGRRSEVTLVLRLRAQCIDRRLAMRTMRAIRMVV